MQNQESELERLKRSSTESLPAGVSFFGLSTISLLIQSSSSKLRQECTQLTQQRLKRKGSDSLDRIPIVSDKLGFNSVVLYEEVVSISPLERIQEGRRTLLCARYIFANALDLLAASSRPSVLVANCAACLHPIILILSVA